MDGIPIEFISREKLQDQSFDELLEMVMDEVSEGKILVLERSLSEDERTRLIEGTMEAVDEDFPGIEFWSLNRRGDLVEKVLDNLSRLVGRERQGITVVGNSDVMEEVEQSEDSLSFLATAAEGD